MCKRSICISAVALLSLTSWAKADISQYQSVDLGISTEPVATNWAVSQLSNDESNEGTQTQTIVVYTSSNSSDSPFIGNLPSSLIFGLNTPSMTPFFNSSPLLGGLGGSVGLSATGHTLGSLSLFSPLSQISLFSGLGLNNPISGGHTFP